MRIKRFSPKQRRVMTWWSPGNPDSRHDAIICDGAVRSGKTLCKIGRASCRERV